MKTTKLIFLIMVVAASALARTASFATEKATTGADSTSHNGQKTKVMSLVSFKAIPSAEAVELTWSLASESNFDYFNVEKSVDGINFITIGKVERGTTDNYKLEDVTPTAGKSFYRLSSVRSDKQAETFQLMLNRRAK